MMKKRIILLALVVCLALAALYALQPQSRGIAYRITDGKNEMIVLGSIHIGSKAMYPLNHELRDAIRQADALVFECDTDSPEVKQVTQEMMFYSGEERLSDHISAETRAHIAQTAQKIGMDDALLETMKPWAITSMLSVEDTSAQMGRATAERGVERVVRKKGANKPHLYLETAAEQLSLMDRFSPELQEYLLETACEAILTGTSDEDLQNWPKWWAEGKAEAFADSYLKSQQAEKKPELAKEYHHSLITIRNQHMAQKLDELLQQGEGKRYFVTIGLMHLVLPDDSVLRELENMGYQVEAI